MAQTCAFEAAVTGLTSATVKVGDGETYDIAAALKEGKGRIVLDPTTDAAIVAALTSHPAVKTASNKPKGKE